MLWVLTEIASTRRFLLRPNSIYFQIVKNVKNFKAQFLDLGERVIRDSIDHFKTYDLPWYKDRYVFWLLIVNG